MMSRRTRPQRNLALLERLTDGGVLREVSPLGEYNALRTVQLDVGPRRCKVLDIDDLIVVKRSLTRPQDVEVALQLEAVRDGIGDSGL